jgi:putative thioredoxin
MADVTAEQFDERVLRRSATVPVVVDFWAAWCAPCRALGPILEAAIDATGGRVELAKVDVDQAQALSQQFGVRGIPAVMAFRHGEVVADFTGARDATFVRQFLEKLAPSAAKEALAQASTAADFEALLLNAEVAADAAIGLARLELSTGNTERARSLLAGVPAASPSWGSAEALLKLVDLANAAVSFGGKAHALAILSASPDNLDARHALGCALATEGLYSKALETWLAVVTKKKNHADGASRKAMVTIFETLGHEHPLTREFRRRLQVVL